MRTIYLDSDDFKHYIAVKEYTDSIYDVTYEIEKGDFTCIENTEDEHDIQDMQVFREVQEIIKKQT